MVDPNNAAALAVALADLARDGRADLADADTADLRAAFAALAEALDARRA